MLQNGGVLSSPLILTAPLPGQFGSNTHPREMLMAIACSRILDFYSADSFLHFHHKIFIAQKERERWRERERERERWRKRKREKEWGLFVDLFSLKCVWKDTEGNSFVFQCPPAFPIRIYDRGSQKTNMRASACFVTETACFVICLCIVMYILVCLFKYIFHI